MVGNHQQHRQVVANPPGGGQGAALPAAVAGRPKKGVAHSQQLFGAGAGGPGVLYEVVGTGAADLLK